MSEFGIGVTTVKILLGLRFNKVREAFEACKAFWNVEALTARERGGAHKVEKAQVQTAERLRRSFEKFVEDFATAFDRLEWGSLRPDRLTGRFIRCEKAITGHGGRESPLTTSELYRLGVRCQVTHVAGSSFNFR